jgi:hypothetical protein
VISLNSRQPVRIILLVDKGVLSSYFISDLLPVHHDGRLRIERL